MYCNISCLHESSLILMQAPAAPRMLPRFWERAHVFAAVLIAASCGGSQPASGLDDLAISDRVRVVDDALYVDQICVRAGNRTIQEIRLEVVLKQADDSAAAETVLSLQARSSRQFTSLLCIGPAQVPGVRRGPGMQLVARLDAVIDGAFHFGEPVSIE